MSTIDRRTFLGAFPCLAASTTAAENRRNILERYQAGINLGTWISQYQSQRPPEFDTRVREADVDQIASWGMDHIRLPIDFDFFEEPGKPFAYREDRLAYADRTLQWAKKNRLNLILDLHRAPGYFFGDLGKNSLFSDELMQRRFLAIWKMFAQRYKAEGENVMFELLNEVVEATPAQWNDLVKRAVAEIRAVDRNRWIVVGGIQYNSVRALKDIAILDDPHIVYTFHFYEPMPLTHQKARWVKPAMDYDEFTGGQRVEYPGEVPRLKEFLAAYPQHKGLQRLVGVNIDKQWLRTTLQPAVDFIKSTGKPLYCGEYGVIRHAPEESRERWYRDVSDILREHKIGRAAWSYKDGSFLFVDRDSSKPTNPEVVRIAARKW